VAERDENLEEVLLQQIESQLHSAGLYTLSATMLRDRGLGEEATTADHQATAAWSRAIEMDALLVWLKDRHPT
jgi:hypothetical protein